MVEAFDTNYIVGVREEPRLTEQQFGNFQNLATIVNSKAERARFGRFYYRYMQAVLAWVGVVWCGVVWCGVVWCVVVCCGVAWCSVVCCGVVWCGVVLCCVVWCGVVLCGVVWCVGLSCGCDWAGLSWIEQQFGISQS